MRDGIAVDLPQDALGIPFLVSGDATGPKDYVKAIYEGFVAGNTIAE